MTRRGSNSTADGLQALVADATDAGSPGLAAAIVTADGAVDLVTSGLAARKPEVMGI